MLRRAYSSETLLIMESLVHNRGKAGERLARSLTRLARLPRDRFMGYVSASIVDSERVIASSSNSNPSVTHRFGVQPYTAEEFAT